MERDPPTLHFSFQGGGAKIGALVVAAKAVYDATEHERVRIGSVSGSSAGAIAAVILASGLDPIVFRDRFVSIGPKYIGKILKNNSKWRIYFRGFTGITQLRRSQLILFFREAFTTPQQSFQKLGDLKIPVHIFTADLIQRRTHVYSDHNDLIETALMNSTALPFLFHTFREDYDYVDGGWLDNLPVAHLLSTGSGIEAENVVALSFYDGKHQEKSLTLMSYALSLVSAAISSNVDRSIGTLPRNNVYSIPVDTDLLDFEGGLLDMQEPKYRGYYELVHAFVTKLIRDKFRQAPKLLESALLNRVKILHSALSNKGSLHCKETVIAWTCNSLRTRNAETLDVGETYVKYEVADGEITVLEFGHLSQEVFTELGDIDVTVLNEYGKSVDCTVIPLDATERVGTGVMSKLLVFFHRPFKKGEKFSVSYQNYAREILYDIYASPQKEDWLSYFVNNATLIDKVYIVAFLPNWMGKVNLEALPSDKRDRPWVDGRMADLGEIRSVLRNNPMDFQPVGWYAENLSRGSGTGVLISPFAAAN